MIPIMVPPRLHLDLHLPLLMLLLLIILTRRSKPHSVIAGFAVGTPVCFCLMKHRRGLLRRHVASIRASILHTNNEAYRAGWG